VPRFECFLFSLTNPQDANIPFEHPSIDVVDSGNITMSNEETNENEYVWMLVCTSLFTITISLLLVPRFECFLFSLTNPQDANIVVPFTFEHPSIDVVDSGNITMSNEETNENDVEPIGKKH
jgi:hypothetical protein